MEEVLDNFEIGAVEDDPKKNVEKISQAIDMCLAKLQVVNATDHTANDPNVDPVDASTYDEAISLTLCQQRIDSLKVLTVALKELYQTDEPKSEQKLRIFHSFLNDFFRKENELHHLEEKIRKVKLELFEAKLTLQKEHAELIEAFELKKEKRIQLDVEKKKKYKSQIENTNIWRGFIRDMIVICYEKFTDRPDLVALLQKYRKPFRIDL